MFALFAKGFDFAALRRVGAMAERPLPPPAARARYTTAAALPPPAAATRARYTTAAARGRRVPHARKLVKESSTCK